MIKSATICCAKSHSLIPQNLPQIILANRIAMQEKEVANNYPVKIPKKRREKTEISVAVGKAIASRRKLANMTQQRLAENLGIEKETVSRLENGEIAQTVDRLDALSKILHCSITDFFEEKAEDSSRYVAAIAHMLYPLTDERQESVMRCVAEIVRAWEV